MSQGSRDKQAKRNKKKQGKQAHQVKPDQEQAEAITDYARMAGDTDQLIAFVTDARQNTIRRQEVATQIGRLQGNAYLSSLLQEQVVSPASAGAVNVQRVDDQTPGRSVVTKFGTYWVVPDQTNQSYVGVIGEQITESAFAILQDVWNKLESGSGNIVITEKDKDGKENAGFKNNILSQFGKLMSQPTGRSVVVKLMEASGGFKVTIRPSASQIYGGANAIRQHGADALEKAGGQAGKGSGTIVQIDPGLKDEDIMVNDKDGKEISDPVFVILGHELIHAQHNIAGRNRRLQPAKSGAYSNLEEEQTVAGGPTTENDIRREHGLKERHGSGGRDTR